MLVQDCNFAIVMNRNVNILGDPCERPFDSQRDHDPQVEKRLQKRFGFLNCLLLCNLLLSKIVLSGKKKIHIIPLVQNSHIIPNAFLRSSPFCVAVAGFESLALKERKFKAS